MNDTFAKLPVRYWATITIALVTAFIFGLLNIAQFLVNALPWGILVLLITAWLGTDKGDALRLGAIFGFFVSYGYLWFDNKNIHSFTQTLILIPLIILPALFGLLCGIVLGYLGWLLQQLFIRKSNEH